MVKPARLEKLLDEVDYLTPEQAWLGYASAFAQFLGKPREKLLFEFRYDESKSPSPILPLTRYKAEEEVAAVDLVQLRHCIPVLEKGKYPLELNLYTDTTIDANVAQDMLAKFRDVSKLAYVNFARHRDQFINGVTGLPTEAALRVHFQHWRQENDPLYRDVRAQNGDRMRVPQAALVVGDSARLGKINKRFGTAAGDGLLRKTGDLFVQYVHKRALSGNVYHLHGDEWAIFIEGVDLASAGEYADQLRYGFQGQNLLLTALDNNAQYQVPVSLATGLSVVTVTDDYENAKRRAEKQMAPHKIELARRLVQEHPELFLEERNQ